MLAATGRRASEASIIGTRAQVLAALYVQERWRRARRRRRRRFTPKPSAEEAAANSTADVVVEVEVVISLDDFASAASPEAAAAASSPASAAEPQSLQTPFFSPDKSSSHGAVEKEMVVARTVSDVADVICDFGAYPQWVTGLQKVEILERDLATGRGDVVRFTAGAMGLSISYTLAYTLAAETDGSAALRLSWVSVAGGVKSIVGSYHLSPTERGDGTVVRYALDVDTGFRMPAMLKRTATGLVIGAALPDLKKHLEAKR